ncbi:MAG: outer membrane protein transport protein [Bacteroidetes bacterium]|nr:outer membrane protein transport protein [Bacteroidota bacterium]
MKKIAITILMAGLSYAHAQNDIDALRYSKDMFGGTGRSAGIASAVGALGAEISSVNVNPASIGMFKKDEMSFSFGMNNFSNLSEYLGNKTKENKFSLVLPNIGLVFCNNNSNKSSKGWSSTVISLGFSRVADFNKYITFSGINTQTSLMDYFAERANGYSIKDIRATDDDFDNGFASKTTMAWEAYLFDSVANKTYTAHASPVFHDIFQKISIQQSGRMYDASFTLTKGYNNNFFAGASLIYTDVKFEESKAHSEVNDIKDTSNFAMDNFTYSDKLYTSGGGISVRLGILQKIGDNFRIGASFQSPQVLNLKDEYSFGINSTLRNGDSYNFSSKSGNFDYSVITPYKFTLSATAVSAKTGFISADVEFKDYSIMRLKSSQINNAMEIANDEIRDKYKNVINYRLGGELIFNSYRLRGGYARYASPFVDKSIENQNTDFISGGFGIKEKEWSFDLGMIRAIGKEIYQPYVLNDKNRQQAVSINKFNASNFIVTFVRKF